MCICIQQKRKRKKKNNNKQTKTKTNKQRKRKIPINKTPRNINIYLKKNVHEQPISGNHTTTTPV
jgi:hypothetical protein